MAKFFVFLIFVSSFCFATDTDFETREIKIEVNGRWWVLPADESLARDKFFGTCESIRLATQGFPGVSSVDKECTLSSADPRELSFLRYEGFFRVRAAVGRGQESGDLILEEFGDERFTTWMKMCLSFLEESKHRGVPLATCGAAESTGIRYGSEAFVWE